MKLILSTTLALMLTTAAAMAFSFPAHEPDGYRDTGCVESERTEITNAAGEPLYTNNPTCPEGNDGHEVAAADDDGDDDEGTDPDDGDEGGEQDGDDNSGDDDTSGDGEK